MINDLFIQPSHKLFIKTKKHGRLSHAYLIECGDSSLHEEIAKEMAKIILCADYYEKDSHNCKKCNDVNFNTSLEFEIIKPEGLSLKMDQLRKLQSKMNKKSLSKEGKVYAIIESDKMSNLLTNSILKFVEEPVEDLHGIFIVKNIYNFPRTLRSRCNLLKYRCLTYESIDNIEEIERFLLEVEFRKEKAIAYTELYNLKYEKDEIKKFLDGLLEIYRGQFKNNLPSNLKEETYECLKKMNNKAIKNRIMVINKYIERINFNANINSLIDNLVIELGEIE